MIEANDNIDLVTMRRQQDFSRAQESYHRAVTEGRLAVRSRQEEAADGRAARSQPGEAADGRAALVAADSGGAGRSVATGAPLPEAVPADPEAAWRHTRLAITAGLVVLLLVIWIWQKRTGR